MTSSKSLLLPALAATLFGAIASGSHGVAATVTPRTIEIVAHRFEFNPRQITLKKGEPVRLVLTSTDVTHGIYVRALKIGIAAGAGKKAEVTFVPDAVGTFHGFCTYFCGAGHGTMELTIVVEEEAESGVRTGP